MKITRTMLKKEAKAAFGPAFSMVSDLSSPRFFYQVGVHIEWKGQPLAVYRVATTKVEAYRAMYEHLKSRPPPPTGKTWPVSETSSSKPRQGSQAKASRSKTMRLVTKAGP